MKLSDTITVSLRKPSGAVVALVRIPNKVNSPDVIERDGVVYIRKTHDVYHEATRLILRD